MRKRFRSTILIVVAAGVALMLAGPAIVGCGKGDEQTAGSVAGQSMTDSGAASRTDLVLASTTSTQDSGLFEVLIPEFEATHPYRVKVVAVGSGEAMAMGRSGDADVLLVHSPAAEKTFMDEGYGVERKAVMYNDFIIVGPEEDPAGIKGMSDAAAALTAIAKAKATFYTRGDNSGTNAKELSIWDKAGITPEGDWYVTTGQGMGATLTVTDQLAGYTLSDRATFLSRKASASLILEILAEGDEILFNQYHVITVKGAVNAQGAVDFMNWIVSEHVQQDLIAPFGAERFGLSLFFPNAGLVE